MKKGSVMRWLLAVLLMTSLVMATSVAQVAKKDKDAPKDPVDAEVSRVAGKTFEQWLKELNAKDPSKRETAIRALVAFEPEQSIKAFGPLVGELKKHGPSTPVDLSIRCNLCIAIGDLVGSGQKIDPKQMADAIVMLKYFLKDQQAIMRYRAALTLSAFGPEAKSAIPDILPMLKDTVTWETRQAGAAALGAISGGDTKYGPPAAVLTSLYSLLQDPAYQVRMTAVQSLGTLGPNVDKEGYVAALLPIALKDPEPAIQIWARVAVIGATQDYKSDNITVIIKHGSSVDPTIRLQAIQGIGAMGSNAKAGIPMLIKSLEDKEVGVQVSAMWALGRMETYAVSALPELEKIIASKESSEYQKNAAKACIKAINGR